MVLAGATRASHPLVVVDLHVELLVLQGNVVGDDELQALIPLRIEVARHGVGLLPLAVEFYDDVGAGGAVAVLGEEVTGVDDLDGELADDRKR